MAKKKSGQWVKRPVIGENYEFSTFGFDIEVEALKIVKKDDKVQVKMVKLINDGSSGDAKQFLEPLQKMINDGHVMEVQRISLRTL